MKTSRVPSAVLPCAAKLLTVLLLATLSMPALGGGSDGVGFSTTDFVSPRTDAPRVPQQFEPVELNEADEETSLDDDAGSAPLEFASTVTMRQLPGVARFQTKLFGTCVSRGWAAIQECGPPVLS